MWIHSSYTKHKQHLLKNKEPAKIELTIARDCLVVIRKLKTETKVVSMNTKLHPLVREFLSIKLKRSRSLKLIKVDAHQDDIKSFNQLTFFEQLNVECALRRNKLIINAPSDEIIPCPLGLKSAHAMNVENKLTLNYVTEMTTYAHLFLCKDYLKKY